MELETVRGHNLGSNACKPTVGIRTGRRMARRSTTSAAAPNRRRCSAWCSSTRRPSSTHDKRIYSRIFLGERLSAAMQLGCAVILMGTALATGLLTLEPFRPAA